MISAKKMMMSAGEDERLAALEPDEDALDAFNDETFGGDGMGETWQEAQHEELAKMTEQERAALQQSQDFFNFGSDGEELGGELEETLEPPPSQNGGGLGVGLAGLSLQPAPPLSVQTQPSPTPAVIPGMVGGFPGHHPAPPHLLPPSHYAAPAPAPYQDPAIMSLSKMPPPGSHPVLYPGQPGAAGATRSSAYSPATVPGLKTLADLEAEMFRPGPAVPPVNPSLHNLNYPGMRDRQVAPRHSVPQQHRHQQQQQQQHHLQQQHQHHQQQQQHQHHEMPNMQNMPQHPRPDMMQRQEVHSMQLHQQRQETVHLQQHQQQMRGSHQHHQQHQQQQRSEPQHHHQQGHHQQQQHHGHHQQQSHHQQYHQQQQAQYRQSPIQQGGRPGPARQENWQYEQERREGQWAGQEREQWGRQEGGGRDWGAHRQDRRDYGRQYDNR